MAEVMWKRVGRGVAVWIPTLLLGALFVMQGLMKVIPNSPWNARFSEWGFPAGFLLLVGVAELLGGIALLIPRFASFGGLLLAAVMFGACGTHLVHGEWLNVGATLGFAAILLLLARTRWSIRAFAGQSGMNRAPSDAT